MASKQLSEDGLEQLEPVSLTFRNIGFSVKDRRTGSSIQILKEIDGRVRTVRGRALRALCGGTHACRLGAHGPLQMSTSCARLPPRETLCRPRQLPLAATLPPPSGTS